DAGRPNALQTLLDGRALGRGMARRPLEVGTVALGRLCGLPLCVEKSGQHEVRCREVRLELDGAAQLGYGALGVTDPREQAAVQVRYAPVLRLDRCREGV